MFFEIEGDDRIEQAFVQASSEQAILLRSEDVAMDFITSDFPREVELYLQQYDDLFPRSEMREHFRYYIAGLISETHRKNVQQIMAKVVEGVYQAGHHFLAHSPWSCQDLNLRRINLWQSDADLAMNNQGWIIQDDTGQVRRDRGKPKAEGNLRLVGGSDGVARQYIGNVGKISEGLVFVSTHYADTQKRLPIVADLYWTESARKSLPVEQKSAKRCRDKIEIALCQLREIHQNELILGTKPKQVVADCWYGSSPKYLKTIDNELKWRYVVAIRPNRKIFCHLPADRAMPEHAAEEVIRFLKIGEYELVKVECAGEEKREKYVVEVSKKRRVKIKGLNHEPRFFICVDDPAQIKPEQTEYLICNDKRMNSEEVVQAYSLRNWEEVYYRQGKDWLGMDECEAQLEERLLRHWALVMVAWTMAETFRVKGTLNEHSVSGPTTLEGVLRLLQDIWRWEFWIKWMRDEEKVKRFVEWFCSTRGLIVKFEG